MTVKGDIVHIEQFNAGGGLYGGNIDTIVRQYCGNAAKTFKLDKVSGGHWARNRIECSRAKPFANIRSCSARQFDCS